MRFFAQPCARVLCALTVIAIAAFILRAARTEFGAGQSQAVIALVIAIGLFLFLYSIWNYGPGTCRFHFFGQSK
jgi:hypothetical protein